MFEGRDVPVRTVELIKRRAMRLYDRMPRCLRDVANAVNWDSVRLLSRARRGGGPNAAARAIMREHRSKII